MQEWGRHYTISCSAWTNWEELKQQLLAWYVEKSCLMYSACRKELNHCLVVSALWISLKSHGQDVQLDWQSICEVCIVTAKSSDDLDFLITSTNWDIWRAVLQTATLLHTGLLNTLALFWASAEAMAWHCRMPSCFKAASCASSSATCSCSAKTCTISQIVEFGLYYSLNVHDRHDVCNLLELVIMNSADNSSWQVLLRC